MSEGIAFGGWLKQRRRETGITQEKLADQIGCSLITLQKIETGERRPSGQVAQLLANFLSIPPDEREAFTTFARTGRVAHIPVETAPGAAGIRAPWRNVYLHQTNLPTVLTPLIGREHELVTAGAHLLNPKVRLLTLTGAPGIGKTRLALQVAADLVDHFEDGVFFVDLAPVVDPDMVLPTVAWTLGLKDSASPFTLMPAQGLLLDYVHERKMLLLLDNFEQVLDAAAGIVKLMEASPWLKVLITSREALHVRGERRLSVPPLEVPNPALFIGPAPHGKQRVTKLASYPSVQLFIERAQDVYPGFELTHENAADIVVMCVELEGLPLAIELAAARANHLTSSEMRSALDNRLKLLTGGGRDRPTRHRTLRSAVEWSYGLLDDAEQTLFRMMGVFVGGCTVAAVETVNGVGAGENGSREPALDVLQALVDKNLVRPQVRSKESKESEEARFTMLEAIREFALEKLIAGDEVEAVRMRHARYFLALAEAGRDYPEGKYQNQWLDHLESEYSNIRAAMLFLLGEVEKSSDRHALELAIRLGKAMGVFWYIRGHADEGRSWLAWTLELQSSKAATLSIAVDSNDTSGLGPDSLQLRLAALNELGRLSWFQSDFKSASIAYGESLAIGKELSDKLVVARALNNLGMVATDEGKLALASNFYEQSLSIARELEEVVGITRLLNNLGVLAHKQGDYTNARRYYRESLDLRRKLGENQALLTILNNLGTVATALGDFEGAVGFHQEALQIADTVGDKGSIAQALLGLGDAALKQGNYPVAHSRYKESLQIGQEVGHKITIIEALEGLARLAAVLNEPLAAARLWGVADMMRTTLQFPMEDLDREQFSSWFADAQLLLDGSLWQAAWAEGHSMTIQEAIEYALSMQLS